MQRPNIVLILADDMGFSDIGCFGSEIKTPNLDALAAAGVRLTSLYNCARCCPTRASLLTGLYPHQAGIGHMIGNLGRRPYQGYLRNDTVTVAELLKVSGYRTYLAGKWHVGGDYDARFTDSWTPGDREHPLPEQRGFDRFFGLLDGASSLFKPHFLMADGQRYWPEPEFYMTDKLTHVAIEMIDEAIAEESPFFLYLAHTAPHWPLHAQPEDIASYQGKYRSEGWDGTRTARHEEMLALGLLDQAWPISPRDKAARPWSGVANKDWEDLRMAVYAAMIDRLDQTIGWLITHLEDQEVRDNTIIIFMSDNGGCAEYLAEDGWARFYQGTTHTGKPIVLGNRPDLKPGPENTFMSYDAAWSNVSNTPFRRHKRFVHEGGISGPAIVNWPGHFGEGTIHHQSCHVVDILPTLLDVTGQTYPSEANEHPVQPLMGESILPLLTGKAWQRQRPIIWEHQGNAAFRDDAWKLVRTFGQPWELYNMADDRTELTDLASKNRAKVTELSRRYQVWADQIGIEPWAKLEPIFHSLYAGGKLS